LGSLSHAERARIRAFRLAGHHLQERLPPGSLLEAAGACGIQNSPPGSALLALHARVSELTAAELDGALAEDRTLLQAWSLRGAPYMFPTRDATVFGLGLLPEDEASVRYFIRGAEPALDHVGISATELVSRTAAGVHDALDGRALSLGPLGVELAQRLLPGLDQSRATAWRSPSWYAPNQSQGEALVHFALHVVALQGAFCLAPRRGSQTPFVRTDQWLGTPLPAADRAATGAELVRRYLRCYGPSTPRHLAAWAGIAQDHAARLWGHVAPELAQVQAGGKPAWLLESDLPLFQAPPPTVGVRLLPPHDPYLDQRDRDTLLPDRSLHHLVWRTVGNPGGVLVDGQLNGTWRARKQGRRLSVSVAGFASLAQVDRMKIETEAQAIATLQGCRLVDTVFAPEHQSRVVHGSI
jgi:hypothetical protein